MVALAWVCSLLGFGLMYVVLLGNAMSTVPVQLTVGVALGLAVLPLVAVVASGMGFYKTFSTHAYVRGLLVYTVPLLLAGAAVVILIGELNPTWLQGGGQEGITLTYQPTGEEPFYQLEIRPAQDNPALGFAEMTSNRIPKPVFVADEVLFTNADVAETWMEGPIRFQGFIIGIAFRDSVQARVEALSQEHMEKRWAIVLNGELFVAPKIVEPLRDHMVLQGDFNETAAGNFARGIVQRY